MVHLEHFSFFLRLAKLRYIPSIRSLSLSALVPICTLRAELRLRSWNTKTIYSFGIAQRWSVSPYARTQRLPYSNFLGGGLTLICDLFWNWTLPELPGKERLSSTEFFLRQSKAFEERKENFGAIYRVEGSEGHLNIYRRGGRNYTTHELILLFPILVLLDFFLWPRTL